MAGLSCAETPAGITSDSSKIAVTIIERRTLKRAQAQDNLVPDCLAVSFADDVEIIIATAFKRLNHKTLIPSAVRFHSSARQSPGLHVNRSSNECVAAP
jgi:hypothetical protein